MTMEARCPERSQEGAQCIREAGHEGNHFAKDAFAYYSWPTRSSTIDRATIDRLIVRSSMTSRSLMTNPDVAGRCPACGSKSLFLGAGGCVTCSVNDCPDPGAASDMLSNSGLLAVTEAALRERNERLDRIERLARGEGV